MKGAVPIDANMQYYSEFVLRSRYFGPGSRGFVSG